MGNGLYPEQDKKLKEIDAPASPAAFRSAGESSGAKGSVEQDQFTC